MDRKNATDSSSVTPALLQPIIQFYILLGSSMLDETLIMIVSDHGGYRRTHGECNGPNTECLSVTMTATMNVPLLLRGTILVNVY